MQKKIDVHGHYFPSAYKEALSRHNMKILDGAPMPKWTEEIQMQYMETLNITTSVLSLSSPHFHFGDKKETVETARACNEYGVDLKKRYPGKFLIMASLPFPDIEKCVEEIRYCEEKLKVDGFALQTNFCGEYLGSESLEPVMQELNQNKAIVVLHPTVPQAVPAGANENLPAAFMEYFFDTTRAITNMIVKGTLKKYPEIRFIVPHAGAFLPVLSDRLATLGGALHMEGLDVMGDLSRLYYDLAGISMPKQYGLLEKITQESHILYGSDAPFTPLPLCERLAADMENRIDASKLENICINHAIDLFKCKR